MTERITVGLLLLFVAFPAAAGEWGVKDLMASLGESSGYRATFRETKHLEVVAEPLVLKGTLLYDPPDHLKKVVTDPHEKIYDIRGDALTIASPEEGARTLSVDRHPMLRTFVDTLRGVLSGDLQSLKAHYRLTLEGQPTDWRLRLEPTQKDVAERIRYVLVQGGADRVHSVKTVEANGDYSLLEVARTNER